MTKCHFSYMDLGEPVELAELGRKSSQEQGDYLSYMDSCLQGLLKVSRRAGLPCPKPAQRGEKKQEASSSPIAQRRRGFLPFVERPDRETLHCLRQ